MLDSLYQMTIKKIESYFWRENVRVICHMRDVKSVISSRSPKICKPPGVY